MVYLLHWMIVLFLFSAEISYYIVLSYDLMSLEASLIPCRLGPSCTSLLWRRPAETRRAFEGQYDGGGEGVCGCCLSIQFL